MSHFLGKRGKCMDELKGVLQVVTPMFCKGAGPAAELRAPSVKGMLRFWYRAVTLGYYGDWKKVRQGEQRVFGSADKGQGIFLLQVEGEKLSYEREPDKKGGELTKGGCGYLAYGLLEWDKSIKGNKLVRQYIQPGGEFSLRLHFKNKVADLEERKQDQQHLIQAIKAWSLFGGMGARSRRGFGSVGLKILTLNGTTLWQPPDTLAELKARMEELLQEFPLPLGLPAYTAWSEKSQVVLLAKEKTPLDALEEAGRALLRYRSAGVKKGAGRVLLQLNNEAVKKFAFPEDSAWLTKAIKENGKGLDRLPDKAVFGLPLGYGNLKVTVGGNVRRASPLFMHIQPVGQEYAAVLSVLPAQFWHGRAVDIKNGSTKWTVKDPQVDFTRLTDFLKGFKDSIWISLPSSK